MDYPVSFKVDKVTKLEGNWYWELDNIQYVLSFYRGKEKIPRRRVIFCEESWKKFKDFIGIFGVEHFKETFAKGNKKLFINSDGHLEFWKHSHNHRGDIHRILKHDEIMRLGKEIGCDTSDIHVHHKNHTKLDNRMENLEVIHKDEHAQRHGHPTWAILLDEWAKEEERKAKEESDRMDGVLDLFKDKSSLT